MMQAYSSCWTTRSFCAACLTLVASAHPSLSLAISPDDPGPAAIQFTLNSGENLKSISPWIYGSNSSSITNRTFDRSGGNRMTGYNWETNMSNAGKDYWYNNDFHLTGGSPNEPPGAAVAPMIAQAATAGRAAIVTVPMAGYVSADAAGPVPLAEQAPSSRFHQVVAKKTTVYPESSLSLTPDKNDDYVFTDEFVNWVEHEKHSGQPVFYNLDNEPALWGESLPPGWSHTNWSQWDQPGRTHPELHPFAPTYSELRDKTIAHASAIKDVNPNALVFGGVGYGWNEFRSLQDAPGWVADPAHPGGDQSGELHYYEWLLKEMAAEEAAQGRPLMDVIDLHWYPEAQGLDNGGEYQRIVFAGGQTDPGVVAARVQAVRSLWDPTYTETSWITNCCSGGPIKLLKHVQRDVDDFKPGTKIAITEYNYGGGNHYSGGIAQADFLGVLGSEGVFAANWWDLGNGSSYVNAAFDLYVNYDGAGSGFGDTSVEGETSNIAESAVYASVDSTDPNRMVVVAINRTGTEKTTGIAVTHDRVFDHAEVYRFAGNSSAITQAADIELDLLNAFQYTMPAWSVTTLVLISDGLTGDFNRDGTVDAADYTVWRDSFGQTGNTAADANEDNIVDAADYAFWKANFGQSELTGVGNIGPVPEPGAITYLLLAALGLAPLRGRS